MQVPQLGNRVLCKGGTPPESLPLQKAEKQLLPEPSSYWLLTDESVRLERGGSSKEPPSRTKGIDATRTNLNPTICQRTAFSLSVPVCNLARYPHRSRGFELSAARDSPG